MASPSSASCWLVEEFSMPHDLSKCQIHCHLKRWINSVLAATPRSLKLKHTPQNPTCSRHKVTKATVQEWRTEPGAWGWVGVLWEFLGLFRSSSQPRSLNRLPGELRSLHQTNKGIKIGWARTKVKKTYDGSSNVNMPARTAPGPLLRMGAKTSLAEGSGRPAKSQECCLLRMLLESPLNVSGMPVAGQHRTINSQG
jgi:hypothetical protein